MKKHTRLISIICVLLSVFMLMGAAPVHSYVITDNMDQAFTMTFERTQYTVRYYITSSSYRDVLVDWGDSAVDDKYTLQAFGNNTSAMKNQTLGGTAGFSFYGWSFSATPTAFSKISPAATNSVVKGPGMVLYAVWMKQNPVQFYSGSTRTNASTYTATATQNMGGSSNQGTKITIDAPNIKQIKLAWTFTQTNSASGHNGHMEGNEWVAPTWHAFCASTGYGYIAGVQVASAGPSAQDETKTDTRTGTYLYSPTNGQSHIEIPISASTGFYHDGNASATARITVTVQEIVFWDDSNSATFTVPMSMMSPSASREWENGVPFHIYAHAGMGGANVSMTTGNINIGGLPYTYNYATFTVSNGSWGNGCGTAQVYMNNTLIGTVAPGSSNTFRWAIPSGTQTLNVRVTNTASNSTWNVLSLGDITLVR